MWKEAALFGTPITAPHVQVQPTPQQIELFRAQAQAQAQAAHMYSHHGVPNANHLGPTDPQRGIMQSQSTAMQQSRLQQDPKHTHHSQLDTGPPLYAYMQPPTMVSQTQLPTRNSHGVVESVPSQPNQDSVSKVEWIFSTETEDVGAVAAALSIRSGNLIVKRLHCVSGTMFFEYFRL